ncbi:hypothetical protein MTR67_036470 [Solanum verrucosum]|uniref:BZIP domain-containing protein n=1 Tax=Solanum verrucosum TaxID=315347 RepID=A0AAF0ZMM4_SOLVR|nr:hypothetical protein MTR67_036470 [Solanum verrucosum]
MRNRENSQIYRQRKKNYVEELEEKVRIMASTIQHLTLENAVFFRSERVRIYITLRS